MDEETRKKAQAIFARLGLTEDEAIELFYKRTIACGRMPFSSVAGDPGEKKKIKRKRMNERFAEWDAF